MGGLPRLGQRLTGTVNILLTYFLSGRAEPFGWALFGAAGGVYLFYRGFRLLQRRRLIMNTPTSKIRSAALGLVEVSGLATGPYTITAPVTGLPCYYHHTMAWEYRQQGKNSKWVKVADESFHLPFYLDDNTGRLLVNPQGAEMDIHRDYHQEFNTLLARNVGMPANVFSFLSRNGISSDKKLKVEEYCIKPKNALFVLGTLAENPGLEVGPVAQLTTNAKQIKMQVKLTGKVATALAQPVLDRLEHMPGVTTRSTITIRKNGPDGTRQELIRLDGGSGPDSTAEMTQQQKIAAALTKAGITNPAAWAAAGVTDTVLAGTSAAIESALTSVKVQDGQISGQAMGFDLHPPVVLMKGEHNPAFFISWRSQKNLLKSLGWESAAMIWGGSALTLICAYYLLVYFAAR